MPNSSMRRETKLNERLAVLHAIFELRITSLQAEAEILEVEEIENLADDVGHGQVLENAAIGLAGEKPKPGHNLVRGNG